MLLNTKGFHTGKGLNTKSIPCNPIYKGSLKSKVGCHVPTTGRLFPTLKLFITEMKVNE